MDDIIEFIISIFFAPFEGDFENAFENAFDGADHIPNKALRIFAKVLLIAFFALLIIGAYCLLSWLFQDCNA